MDGDLISPTHLERSSKEKTESGKQEEEIPFLFLTVEVYHGGVLIGPTLFRW